MAQDIASRLCGNSMLQLTLLSWCSEMGVWLGHAITPFWSRFLLWSSLAKNTDLCLGHFYAAHGLGMHLSLNPLSSMQVSMQHQRGHLSRLAGLQPVSLCTYWLTSSENYLLKNPSYWSLSVELSAHRYFEVCR